MWTNINWDLLREQKTWLIAQPACSEVDGLINLLDALQDAAIMHGISEEEVFGEQDEILFEEG